MRNSRTLLVLILMAGSCLAAPSQFRIVVWDYAGLPDRVIAPAVDFAHDVFREAGIDASWAVCHAPEGVPEACPLAKEGQPLSMLVVPKMLGAPRGPAPSGDVAGLAIIGREAWAQPRGWAFYDAVAGIAQRTKHPLPMVLGCVLVHEISHILGLRHREDGIMCASLGPRELDEAAHGYFFSSSESRLLRQAALRFGAPMRDAIASRVW